MKKIYFITFIWFALIINCAPRDNALRKIADNGTINPDGALISTATIEIDASEKYVWDIITNIPDWPNWNPEITKSLANGITFKGDNFAWRWGKKINSSVHYFDPPEKLAWFSKSMAYRSIIVWKLESLGKNKTRVTLSESRDGFFMNFLSSKKHKQLLVNWLNDLKNRSEVVRF
ncbi:MAG: SRPBCC family protein [Spirochaetia bacterium]|nr:SRPBCC family protein [Spirochaetia bacterium]